MPRHPRRDPATVATSLRSGLTRGDDVVDVATWAGSVPAATGVAPRVRLGRKWFNLLWLLPLGFVLLLVAVAVAKGLRQMPVVAGFIARYPGTTSTDLPDTVGISVWARWQHFLNLFLMIFILRSGLQILSDHPRLYWTRHCTPGREWLRVQKPVPPDPLWTADRTQSVFLAKSGCPACDTRSAWPAGGTWASTSCGCSTAWPSTSCCSPPGTGIGSFPPALRCSPTPARC